MPRRCGLLALVLALACACQPTKRLAFYATCGAHGECESDFCYQGRCTTSCSATSQCGEGACIESTCKAAVAIACGSDDECETTLGPRTCRLARCTAGQCALSTRANATVCAGANCVLGTCEGGICKATAGAPGGCDDGNSCTADSCGVAGCSQQPDLGGACNDGNACTAGDACVGTACQPGAAAHCDDANPCTIDSCQAGVCKTTAGAPAGPEFCDGKDNDCNGLTDDNLNIKKESPCNHVGVCEMVAGTCSAGKWLCQYEGVGDFEVKETLCDFKDNDCNGLTDEAFATLGQACDGADADQCTLGTWTCSADGKSTTCGPESLTDIAETCADIDGDGFLGPADCNELDAGFSPIAVEGCCPPSIAGQGAAAVAFCDHNCDSQFTQCAANDLDFDGFAPPADCDDDDPQAHPSAADKCGDGVDQDCNGTDVVCAQIVDSDGDGFADTSDCKPNAAFINPSAIELCNGLDDNCNGVTDEGNPGAQPGLCGSSQGICVPGQQVCVSVAGKALITCVPKQGAKPETCNTLDDNCNGITDEGFETKGKKCDPGADGCALGLLQCVPGGTMSCVGDVAGVASTTCKKSPGMTEVDVWLCGTGQLCSVAQGDKCVAGLCTCGGKPACAGAKQCLGGVCQ